MSRAKVSKQAFLASMTKYSMIQPFGAPDFANPMVLDFWYDELGRYSGAQLGDSFRKLCCKTKFPSINEVKIECGDGEVSDESIARDTADRIWGAIGKYGSGRWERALEYIGEVGERVVGGASGWNSICETATNNNSATLKAQWRESAKGQLEIARKGMSGPARLPLPSGKNPNPKVQALIEESVNNLANVNGGKTTTT